MPIAPRLSSCMTCLCCLIHAVQAGVGVRGSLAPGRPDHASSACFFLFGGGCHVSFMLLCSFPSSSLSCWTLCPFLQGVQNWTIGVKGIASVCTFIWTDVFTYAPFFWQSLAFLFTSYSRDHSTGCFVHSVSMLQVPNSWLSYLL